MWHSAAARHKHCQALYQWLQHNCSSCEEYTTRVVLMVHIGHHILSAMYRRHKCHAAHHLGNGKRVNLHQRVQGSVKAIRAVRITQVFLTETRVVADISLLNPNHELSLPFPNWINLPELFSNWYYPHYPTFVSIHQ